MCVCVCVSECECAVYVKLAKKLESAEPAYYTVT